MASPWFLLLLLMPSLATAVYSLELFVRTLYVCHIWTDTPDWNCLVAQSGPFLSMGLASALLAIVAWIVHSTYSPWRQE
jgi:hypothetical protein